jgi:Nucleotidyl transferase of unknown function (DUF2204)
MELSLPKDFREFLSLLHVHGVKYLLVGGYAVGFHGYPRATNDLDIWIATTHENASQLLTAFREFGFDTPELSVELILEMNQILRMGLEPIRIDVLKSIWGVTFDSCYSNRVTASFDGISVNVISLKDLKTNKEASGRLKDLADIEHLS